MSSPLSRQGTASALQARSRLSQLLCSEARAPRNDPISELFRCGAVAKMGVEAFAVYTYLFSRYPSEHPTIKDIAQATGMNEISVNGALQTLVRFEPEGACPDRGVQSRVHETIRQYIEPTKQTL